MPGSSSRATDSSLRVHPVERERVLELARRRLHVRADQHEPVTVARAARVERLGAQRRRGLDAAAHAHERRAAAIDEGLPGRLGLEQPEHHHLEVGVLRRVDHHGPARLGLGQDLAHALGPAAADVLEPEAEHVVGAHGAARLLLDPAPEVRGGVAEGAVGGVGGAGAGDELVVLRDPLDVVDGEAPGLQEAGAQQQAVDGLAGRLQRVGHRVGLLREVAAHGRVAAARDGELEPLVRGDRRRALGDLRAHRDRPRAPASSASW